MFVIATELIVVIAFMIAERFFLQLKAPDFPANIPAPKAVPPVAAPANPAAIAPSGAKIAPETASAPSPNISNFWVTLRHAPIY